MPETGATKVRKALVGLLIGLAIAGGGYVTLRLRATYDLQTQFSKLKIEHDQLRSESVLLKSDVTSRLDSLERALFGDVFQKLLEKEPKPVQAPVRLQQWMVNRDKDLRERLERIERRLLQIEASK